LYLPSADRIYTPGILKEDIDLKVPGVESAIRIVGTWEPACIFRLKMEILSPLACYLQMKIFLNFSATILLREMHNPL